MILANLVLTCVSAAAVALAQPATTPERPRIVAFGDSLTSGRGLNPGESYPAILQDRIDRAGLSYAVVNAGVSGDTSRRALRRFDDALEGGVRILILALGANDGLRGVPVAQLRSNLSQMIEKAERRHIAVLLCGMEALPIYGWDYSVAFHTMYDSLATEYRVTLVPFILLKIIGDPSLMQPDRAHPNAAGARAIADQVWPYLEPMLQARTGAPAAR